MFESDFEMRRRLNQTWKKLIERLEDSEFSAPMVYETLAEVAIEGMVEEHGVTAATHLLRMKADAIETSLRNRMVELMIGETSVALHSTASA